MTQTATIISLWNAQAAHLTAIDALQRFQWSVFPLDEEKMPPKTGGTHPDGSPKRLKWKPQQTQRATIQNIEQWNTKYHPDAWAIITGSISNVVILDFDGDHGRETLQSLGINPHVRTGSGGFHIYFQHPGWHVPTLNSESKKELGRRWPGLDIRADGGYAAFCGHNTKGQYTWLCEPTPDELSILPDNLREFLGLLHAPEETKKQTPHKAPTSYSRPPTQSLPDIILARALDKAGLDGRNNAGFGYLAQQLRDNNILYAEAESIMRRFVLLTPSTNTKGQNEAYTEQEAMASLRSAYDGSKRDPWPDNRNKRHQQLEDEMLHLANGNKRTSKTHNNNHSSEQATSKERSGHLTPNPVDLEFILDCLDKNEYGDALLCAEAFAGQIIYDHSEKDWYIWHGHHWKKDRTGRIKQLISGYIGSVYLKAAADLNIDLVDANAQLTTLITSGSLTEAEKDPRVPQLTEKAKTIGSQMKALNERAKALRTAKRNANVQSFAQAELGVTGEVWDSDPWLLGVKNGVLDLHTGECRDGRPDDYIRSIAPTEWIGLDAPCPRFTNFLKEIFEDRTPEEQITLIKFLQRLLGYAINGLTTEHIFPILWGDEGRNGKDTLLQVLHDVLGPTAGAIPNDLMIASDKNRTAGAATPHLGALQGKRLVWGSETSQGERLNAAQIKLLTGGGEISTRALYGKEFYTFKPTHTLLLLTNFKPHANAHDKAFWERACLIEFKMRFIDNPQDEKTERKKDSKLASALKTEASGILAWLVCGCLEWKKQGLNRPESVLMATDNYRQSEDRLQIFIEECCYTWDKNARIKASELYSTYQDWCKDNGIQPKAKMNSTAFGLDLSKKYPKKRVTDGVFYFGIRLKAENEPNPDLDPKSMNSSESNSKPFIGHKEASEAYPQQYEQSNMNSYEQCTLKVASRDVQTSDSRLFHTNGLHTIHANTSKRDSKTLGEPIHSTMNSLEGLFITPEAQAFFDDFCSRPGHEMRLNASDKVIFRAGTISDEEYRQVKSFVAAHEAEIQAILKGQVRS